jgi:soluble lytic murein transglycosylase-like protein
MGFRGFIEAPIDPDSKGSPPYDGHEMRRDERAAIGRRSEEVELPQTRSWQPQAVSILAIALLASAPAHACWDEAAARYGVSSTLLYAIARTESGLNPQAIGRNRNGTRDIGLMQINSAWLPTLATRGIGERELLEPCTNIQVGAWILAGNVQRLGYTWDAVGAYNAESPALRRAYAQRVYRHVVAASVPFDAALRPLPSSSLQTSTSAR